jgi:hypothetical protein
MSESLSEQRLWIDVIVIGALTLVISYAFARGVLAASRGQPIDVVFVCAFIAWGGYLLAHYYETGQVIDPGSESREFELPDRLVDKAGIAFGSCLLVVAVPIGIYGMYLDAVGVTGGGVVTFLLGYYCTHYFVSGNLL